MKKGMMVGIAVSATLIGGCGGGLPACDSAETKGIVKDIVLRKQYTAVGHACLMPNAPIYRVLHRSETGKCSMGQPVDDVEMELTAYTVKASQTSADGLSNLGRIKTRVVFTSEQADFTHEQGSYDIELALFQRGEDGSRSYEFQTDYRFEP